MLKALMPTMTTAARNGHWSRNGVPCWCPELTLPGTPESCWRTSLLCEKRLPWPNNGSFS